MPLLLLRKLNMQPRRPSCSQRSLGQRPSTRPPTNMLLGKRWMMDSLWMVRPATYRCPKMMKTDSVGERATSVHLYEEDVARRWWALPLGVLLPLSNGGSYQLVFAGRPGG